MAGAPKNAKAYLDALPADRRAALRAVRAVVNKHLPKGYKEVIQYGMIGWSVPHSIYPAGYHCSPELPVPYAALASQKNHMAIYMMGIYGSKSERQWLERAWKKTGKKLDAGKSCIRFKRLEDLPLEVIGEAIARLPVADYIASYEKMIPASKRGGAKKKSSSRKATSRKSAKKKAAKKKAARKRPAKKKAAAARKSAKKAAPTKGKGGRKATPRKKASKAKRR